MIMEDEKNGDKGDGCAVLGAGWQWAVPAPEQVIPQHHVVYSFS